jgi:hypothetical protein
MMRKYHVRFGGGRLEKERAYACHLASRLPYDSYPDGLGRELWKLYRGHFGQDLDRMLQELLDEHPAGWSSLSSLDLERGLFNALTPGDPLDPPGESGPNCYCHGDHNEEAWEVNEQNASASGIEWSYVFTSSYVVTPARAARPSGSSGWATRRRTGAWPPWWT